MEIVNSSEVPLVIGDHNMLEAGLVVNLSTAVVPCS